MSRFVGLSALLLTACTGGLDGDFTRVPSEILISPAIVDLGEVAVGGVEEFTLTIEHIAGADVAIRDVGVFNVEGSGFDYVGEDPIIPRFGEAEVLLAYAPTEHGYSRAVVTVLSDSGVNPEVVVDVRARGVQPNLSRWPSVVDFGPMEIDRTAVREVTVFNDSALSLVIEDGTVDGVGFELDEAFPIPLPAHSQIEIDIRYTADNTFPSEGDLVLDFGGTGSILPVVVKANACETGASALYDTDMDGWSTCAGDCDDGNARIHPGGVETVDNVDQDCNGYIDDGTVAYDDDGDGYAERDGDCNDNDPNIGPHTHEIGNDGLDNDCNGIADTGTDDIDGDGVTPGGGDCDDRDSSIHPGAVEAADGDDNDCDGVIDEGTILYDDDGDGFCESTGTPCSDGAGLRDCDDTSADRDGDGVLDGVAVGPGAVEAADGVDNDCDGDVDEGTVRGDDDQDGFTELGGDCDDNNAFVNPGQVERPGNGFDDDCSAGTPD